VFSATVAAFLIESYKLLLPDPALESATLLRQATEQLAAISNGVHLSPPSTADDPFRPKRYAIHVNILWFLSLTLSLSCALAATLVQQWTRRYLRLTQSDKAPKRRVWIRTYLFNGMKIFHTRWVVENISLLMHAAIFLFFAGLIEFLFAVNDEVAMVILVAVCILGATYVFVTALPVVFNHCPYQTPLTSCIWYTGHFLGIGAVSLFEYSKRVLGYSKRIRDKIHSSSEHVRDSFYDHLVKQAKGYTKIHEKALKSALTSCGGDGELETFVEAIPSYLRGISDPDQHIRVENIGSLLEVTKENEQVGLRLRIVQLLASCIDADGRMDKAARRQRAITCARAVWEISRVFPSAGLSVDLPESACKTLHRLSQDHDPAIALATLSVIAMLERALVEQLLEPEKKKDEVKRTKTFRLLNAVLGESDPFSTCYQVCQSHNHKPDGRMIAATKFISSVLSLIPHMERPSHEDLDTTRRTLDELCRSLDREKFSASAQRDFAKAMAEVKKPAAARSAGKLRAGFD
jgi:Family of unknown function (DUF6535)